MAATILRLLGNKTIQLNTLVNKSEPGLRKLKINVKSTTKSNYSLNIFQNFSNKRCFRFQFLYFKRLQALNLCVTAFYKTPF